ncbi:hypothetical protein [Methylobacterium nonmethylotrophicum]|uniref:Uncharacterized protein n=1 Tax=Methylobacterium nonmethylotrophicum TaxID=1141884 RepID=A0A4Z0NXE1_9HYPH|nr:hypothetical protein [Methylobacterium nonmethylotrophicum]TGE02335.1 hypothetical protein EU555_00710 [Methylobacterium nonmethylotrophicum]
MIMEAPEDECDCVQPAMGVFVPIDDCVRVLCGNANCFVVRQRTRISCRERHTDTDEAFAVLQARPMTQSLFDVPGTFIPPSTSS